MEENIKDKAITKTEPDKGPINLVVSEINISSADNSQKDIEVFIDARNAAKSIINPNRIALYDLYDDIMLDGHLTGIVGKRIGNVLNKDIVFVDKDGKQVEEMNALIESDAFREVIRYMIEAPLYGVSGMEFIPGKEFAFQDIPRKHIKPEYGMIVFEQGGNTGIEYKDVDNILIIGKKKDLGLLLKCAPYAIWKRGTMADWSQYIEIFGQPVRIIKYDAFDQKTKAEIKTVLDESGSSLALMIPKQAEFEMRDGKQSNGDGKLQDSFKIACNNEMSVIILGNTETTTSSSSSGYAQSVTHGKQQQGITRSDMKYALGLLNQKKFLKICQSYGYPVAAGGRFKFEKEIDLESLKGKLDIDLRLKQDGLPVTDDYLYETYDVPKPDNYDELVAKKEADKQAALDAMKKKANEPEEDPEDPEEEEDPTKEKQPSKGAKKPLKKSLKAEGFFFQLRAALADFFDPAL